MAKLITVEEVARVFGRRPRQIQRWVREGILPQPSERGRYDIGACIRAYIAHAHSQLEAMGVDPQEGESFAHLRGLQEERARLTKAQAARGELELAKARGELVSVDRYESDLTTFAMAFRTRILMLNRIAPQLEGQTREVIEERLRKEAEVAWKSAKATISSRLANFCN